ncbi:BAG family molecular chaperone regulator 4 isoform X2 [Strix aluco]|uniref:BAG family molecular chaperone regulator 4 isoform X2 n=1 Tax=Strix aluco TaxID=111821 RepID=UPI003DA1FCCE
MEPRDRAAEPGPPWPPGSPRPPAAQAMDSPYANGAYSPPYPPAPGAALHYAGLPQARGYYCSGPPRPPYPTESTGMYQPPSPAPPWSYAAPDCPAEGSSLRRQQVPGYSPPQTPGMPIPQYPYGDSSPGVTAQGPPPQPRAPEDTWAPHAVYGVQPRYAWPAASAHGSPFASESHPPWPGSGAPPHPPAWDSKKGTGDTRHLRAGLEMGQTSSRLSNSSLSSSGTVRNPPAQSVGLSCRSQMTPQRFGPQGWQTLTGGFGGGEAAVTWEQLRCVLPAEKRGFLQTLLKSSSISPLGRMMLTTKPSKVRTSTTTTPTSITSTPGQ